MVTGENGLSYVGWSLDGSTSWNSLMAYTGNIRVGGGALRTGEFVNFQDDYPLVQAGRFEVNELAIRLLYTEGTTEPYARLRELYDAKTKVYLRWSYGAATTHYFKALGLLTNVPLPEADASSADPLAVEITQRVDGAIVEVGAT